ncbi:hypothetical protein MTR67_006379 [Solanum verrucosum]|uniref:Uncharacterized protein n=1 Tax=Solanum verrucosum TaxID=315347 RepID=A0AAF0Q3X8_SOLVR|nr:hypothetical protein MTR67_006379 [Solanum verrucosum]
MTTNSCFRVHRFDQDTTESSAKSSEVPYGAKRRKIASGRIKLWRCYGTRSRTNKLHDRRLVNVKNLNLLGNNSLTKSFGGKLVRQSMITPVHSAAETEGNLADFLRHISEESPDKATLKGLSGGTWNVKLQCDGRGLSYTQRLEEISEKLPTRIWGISLFGYETLLFTVRIFSKNGLERELCGRRKWHRFMSKGGGSIISEFFSAEFRSAVLSTMSASDMVIRGEGHHRPKLEVQSFGCIF